MTRYDWEDLKVSSIVIAVSVVLGYALMMLIGYLGVMIHGGLAL